MSVFSDTLGSEASLVSQLSVCLCVLQHCLFCSLTCKTQDYHERAMAQIHVLFLNAKVISSGTNQSLLLLVMTGITVFVTLISRALSVERCNYEFYV